MSVWQRQGVGNSRPLSSIDEIEIPGPAVPIKRHQLALVIHSFMIDRVFRGLRCA